MRPPPSGRRRRGLAAARAGGSRRGRRGGPPPEAQEPGEVGPIDGIVPADDDPGPVVDKLVYNRGLSRLFVDSASVEAHARLLPTGAFYGVTTNPLLLERDGQKCTFKNLMKLATQALDFGAEEVQLQTWGATAKEMVNNGLRLAGIGPEITVKVPITRIGIEAASDLTAESVATTMTGIHCPHQAFTAMAMGADYAAPYLGRMNDAGRDGFGAIEAMLRMTTASESAMRVLVASVRSVEDIERLAAVGGNTFAVPPAVGDQLFQDELTLEAAAAFEDAVARTK